MVAHDNRVGAPPRDRERVSHLHQAREGDVIVRPGWAYGLYRYKVPPEEEEEMLDEGVAYSLPAEGKWRTPTGRGRQLVTFVGQLAGKKVNVLIDSGSTLDLINTGRAQELGMATHSIRRTEQGSSCRW